MACISFPWLLLMFVLKIRCCLYSFFASCWLSEDVIRCSLSSFGTKLIYLDGFGLPGCPLYYLKSHRLIPYNVLVQFFNLTLLWKIRKSHTLLTHRIFLLPWFLFLHCEICSGIHTKECVLVPSAGRLMLSLYFPAFNSSLYLAITFHVVWLHIRLYFLLLFTHVRLDVFFECKWQTRTFFIPNQVFSPQKSRLHPCPHLISFLLFPVGFGRCQVIIATPLCCFVENSRQHPNLRRPQNN